MVRFVGELNTPEAGKAWNQLIAERDRLRDRLEYMTGERDRWREQCVWLAEKAERDDEAE